MRVKLVSWVMLVLTMMCQQVLLAVEIYYPVNGPQNNSRLSGSLLSEISYQDITGHKSSSFYKKGWDYLSQANLSARGNINDFLWNMELFLQKTDADYVDSRNDIRLKEFSSSVSKQGFWMGVGQYYQFFSDFSLSAQLLGLGLRFLNEGNKGLDLVLGRTQQADSFSHTYDRYTMGLRLKGPLAGISIVTSQDDSSSLGDDLARDLDNTVVAIDGSLFRNSRLRLFYEGAYSSTVKDEDDPTSNRDSGLALRVHPVYNGGKIYLGYKFEYIEPKFFTAVGSAIPDRILHRLEVTINPSQLWHINWVGQYDYDHINKDSQRSYKTENYHQIISYNYNYLGHDVTLYLDCLTVNSLDVGNTRESMDLSWGLDVIYDLDKNWKLKFGYERRNYSCEADKSLSEYGHRISSGIVGKGKFFQKDCVLNLNMGFYYRNAKSRPKGDLTFSIEAVGSYRLSRWLTIRYNLNQDENNFALIDSDSRVCRSSLDFDVHPYKNKNVNLIFSLQSNRYSYQDSNLDYKENRAVLRVIWRF